MKNYSFRSLNIKLREDCVVSGKTEDKIVLRTQFNSRICLNFDIFLASVIKSVTAKTRNFRGFNI